MNTLKTTLLIIAAFVLLPAIAHAQIEVTETFEHYPGPNFPTQAETLHAGMAVFSGGQAITSDGNTVYETLGQAIDFNPYPHIVMPCKGGQPYIKIDFDETVLTFDLDVFGL